VCIVGFFLGVTSLAIVVKMFGTTPSEQLYKDRQEVVGRGFAHWEATTNGVSIFVWHTNKSK